MKALLSVSDRAGLADLGKSLVEAGFELVSTGGTGAALADAGLPVTQVADLTGSPEILDGRVKTLHPKIHGAILARRDLDSHLAELAEHGIGPIDLVAVNLYPFVETVTGADATLEEALENIDIGGPTLLRAAAKNFPDVLVVVDPDDYGWLGQRLAAREPVTLGGAQRARPQGLPARGALRQRRLPLPRRGRRRDAGGDRLWLHQAVRSAVR